MVKTKSCNLQGRGTDGALGLGALAHVGGFCGKSRSSQIPNFPAISILAPFWVYLLLYILVS